MASSSLVARFNEKSQTGSFNPRVTPLDLIVGKPYKITMIKAIHNEKYGRSIVVVLRIPEKCTEENPAYYCFLPGRFVPLFFDKEIERYNLSPDLALVYQGMGKRRELLVNLEENWE